MISNDVAHRLVAAAREAAARAYCPHSGFRVGAAVLAGDEIFMGCNVENDSYPLTMCAERVAIFNAIAAGHRAIAALAVACPDAPIPARVEERISCGACRQVLQQFAANPLIIILDGIGSCTLAEIFPTPFKLPAPPAPLPDQQGN